MADEPPRPTHVTIRPTLPPISPPAVDTPAPKPVRATRSSGPPAPPRPTDETIKETFESIVIAFILAFIFRAYVVEAFIIPTGSMAPTLLGRHFDVGCHQCGYRFTLDHGGNELDPLTRTIPRLEAPCPMCKYPQPLEPAEPPRSGDRLLVQKYLYHFSEPRRWDIVVFRNPQTHNDDGTPGPKTNYIKRLVGLPNEALYLIDGNVYVKPLDAPEEAWRIARKTDAKENRHWEKIQRSVWVPVYHSRYVPRDAGRIDAPGLDGQPPLREEPWLCPWRPAGESAGDWDLGGPEAGWRRAYTFAPSRESHHEAYEPWSVGELRFDWKHYHDHGTVYPYNSLVGSRDSPGVFRRQPIEDVRLAATLAAHGTMERVELETSARLAWGPETLVARFWANGKLSLVRVSGDRETVLTQANLGRRLDGGQRHALELWFVDQEALVFVDGAPRLRHRFEVPMQKIAQRPPPAPRPGVAIRVVGGAATLSDVELDRDLAYTPSLSMSASSTAKRAATYRAADGKLVRIDPVRIQTGRYFVLGDNSPISNDSRFWRDVEPWVERNMFARELSNTASWPGPYDPPLHAQVVPRGLLVGRAFFIYFPAPYAVRPGGRQALPNFGDMRFVH